MIINPYAFGGGSVVVTFDPAYIQAARLSLSGGNLIATRNSSVAGNWGSVLTTAEIVGLKYWEFVITTGHANIMLGIGRRTMDLTNFPGQVSDTYGYYASSGVKYNNNSGSAYGASYTTGDVIGVAVNKTTGKLWFSKNGTWQNSGDPAAGTGEAFTGMTGSLYGCYSAANASVVTGRFTLGSFSNAPPTGFSALES